MKDNKFVGGELACIGDLVAFYDITMLEVLDIDLSGYSKITRWIGEMRAIKEVTQADAKFQASKDKLKELRKSNAKL